MTTSRPPVVAVSLVRAVVVCVVTLTAGMSRGAPQENGAVTTSNVNGAPGGADEVTGNADIVAPAAPTVALLPIQAPALMRAAQNDLETRVRALAGDVGMALQPAEQTDAHVAEALSAGLSCTLAEVSCAQRIGLLADVEKVLVVGVEPIEGKLLMRAKLLSTSSEDHRAASGAIKAPATDGGESVKLLLRKVSGSLNGATLALEQPVRISVEPAQARIVVDDEVRKPGVIWLLPGTHKLRVDAPEHVSIDRELVVDDEDVNVALALQPLAVEVNVPLLAGLGVAGLGALVGGSGVAMATVAEVQLASGTTPFADRGDVQSAGIVGLGATVVGTVILAAGAAVAVVGVLE